MTNWPPSPTKINLEQGVFVLPEESNGDPYETVGVWPDGTTVYWRDSTELWVSVYDRDLDTDPPTGVGWRSFRATSAKQTFRFTYDYSVNGGAIGSIALTDHDGPLPINFIIQNAFIDVITALTSSGAATGALTTGQGAGDLVAATVVAGAPWSTTGQKVTIPLLGTVATWIKTTAERDPALVVATAALATGKFNLFLEGYLSA